MNDQTRLTEYLQPLLNDGQFYIVDVAVTSRAGGRTGVSILLDSDTGITIEECARISRQLGAVLDESDLFGGAAFTLEVSSPGIDQPLRLTRQYVRNLGRQLSVTLAGGTVLTGRLDAVEDGVIVLDIPPAKKPKKNQKGTDALDDAPPDAVGPTPVPLADIKLATVEIAFK